MQANQEEEEKEETFIIYRMYNNFKTCERVFPYLLTDALVLARI